MASRKSALAQQQTAYVGGRQANQRGNLKSNNGISGIANSNQAASSIGGQSEKRQNQ